MNVLSSQILAVAKTYSVAVDVPLGIASDRSCGDGRVLPRLEQGSHSLTVRRADAALLWFSENWPEGVEWPAEVPRPVAGEVAA